MTAFASRMGLYQLTSYNFDTSGDIGWSVSDCLVHSDCLRSEASNCAVKVNVERRHARRAVSPFGDRGENAQNGACWTRISWKRAAQLLMTLGIVPILSARAARLQSAVDGMRVDESRLHETAAWFGSKVPTFVCTTTSRSPRYVPIQPPSIDSCDRKTEPYSRRVPGTRRPPRHVGQACRGFVCSDSI